MALPKKDPLKCEGMRRYIPRAVTPRLRVQTGVFTVHSKATKIFRPKGFARVSIPCEKRKIRKDSLFRYGVHEGVLFPNVDGLARNNRVVPGPLPLGSRGRTCAAPDGRTGRERPLVSASVSNNCLRG